MGSLLSEIEAFIQTHSLSHFRFGREAIGDNHFVEDLRNGRRCWPETEARVRLYMATYKPDAA